MKSNFIIFIFILLSIRSFASVGEIPGTVPLEFLRPPATDLFYKGKILLPHEALELYEQGLDISRIDPKESDIWKNIHGGVVLNPEMDDIGLNSEDEVKYLASVYSRIGKVRFSIAKDGPLGKKFYTITLGRKIHNILLRSAILRKLGYTVPAIKHIPKLVLKFSIYSDYENFFTQIREDAMADPDRWVVSSNADTKTIILRDVLAYEPNNEIYNLAIGHISADAVIKGRRVFNSLLIPYAMTFVPETVNQFNWHMGTVIDKFVRFDYNDSGEFSTPYEDALWIIHRLKQLTEDDYFEIARMGCFPKEVELLVAHKLISRRNALMRHFQIETNELQYDHKISSGEYLVDGKLIKENWEGYASRFAYGDEDSPLSSSELFSYFKSKAISNAIFNLVNLFNREVIPRVDIQNELINRQMTRAFDAYRNYLLHGGSPEPVPVSVFAIPTINGRLIASREIVAGSYLGTDNVVQLVDAIGASVSVGAYLGTDKVAMPWLVSGNVSGFITRVYSHVRPIKSMKKALKIPFKNILVPMHKRKIAHMLDEVIDENLNNEEIDFEERQKKLKEILAVFKNNLEVGESLIITDTLGAGFGIRGGYQIAANVKAYIAGKARQILISRMHIHRKSNDSIQIYKDFGNVGNLGLSFGVNAFIPVLTISYDNKKGTSKTKFYTLNINDDIRMNPGIFDAIRALRLLLLRNSLELVKDHTNPYELKHKYNQDSNQFSLLIFKRKGIKSKDFITIKHPQGAKKYFYRRVIGHREGIDYQNTILDVINAIVREVTGMQDISLSTQDGVNPGDTLYGKAFSRSVVYEGEIKNPSDESYSAKGDVSRSIVNIYHRWKGWKMSKHKAQKILDRINEKYGSELYPRHILNDTEELQLYQVKLFISFYERAIKHIINLPKDQVKEIFDTHADIANLKRTNVNDDETTIDDLIRRARASFYYYRKKINKWKVKRDLAKISYYTSKMISIVESSLKIQGMLQISGGEKGLYIYSRMEGFRLNDEGGERPFVSNSLGQIGSSNFRGPLFDIQSKMGITESEFFGYWIQDRL